MTDSQARSLLAGLLGACVLLCGCEDSSFGPSSQYQLSSNWDAGAVRRMMNVASPHMPDETAKSYIDWMKGREANTAHVILSNQGDGEYSGYCIYGKSWDWEVDEEYVDSIRKRVGWLRGKFDVVLWLLTDDSPEFNRAALSDPERYVDDLSRLGLLDGDGVCLGLELDEYASAGQVAALAAAVRARYDGDVGVHHTSGKTTFATLADTLYYQTRPGISAREVATNTRKALATGKMVVYFELAHSPARELCQAALDAGAEGAGNW